VRRPEDGLDAAAGSGTMEREEDATLIKTAMGLARPRAGPPGQSAARAAPLRRNAAEPP
jgi:hypothetical protein